MANPVGAFVERRTYEGAVKRADLYEEALKQSEANGRAVAFDNADLRASLHWWKTAALIAILYAAAGTAGVIAGLMK